MPKEISIVTLVNNLPVDPKKSLLPIQMVGDRVVLEPIEPSKYLDDENKIEKPVDYKEPYMKGKVVSIGSGEYGSIVPVSMEIGMIVHYWHQQAYDFVINKVKYQMVRASDVFMYL